MNFDELRTKAEAVIKAYEQIEELLGQNDDKAAAIEVQIDETYSLVAVRGGAAMFILEGDNIVLDYIPDDDWTPGDIIGGFIDLYMG